MPDPCSARLSATAPGFVQRATASELEDWLAYADPDAILLADGTGEGAPRRAMDTLRRHAGAETVLFDGSGAGGVAGPRRIGGVQFVFAPAAGALAEVRRHEGDALDPDEPTFVVSDLLGLDVDTTALSASLLGREAYVGALDPAALDGEYVHLSTRLPAQYRREWDGLTVVGAGAAAGTAGNALVALDCRTDGRALTTERQPSRLGLRALDGVGATRAGRLREAGFRNREAVAGATLDRLADVPGLGQTSARRIRDSARAMVEGTVVRLADGSLPGGDPVFVDIETDGLSPTVTWLIGVLDGSGTEPAADVAYRSFLATDPDEPGRAVAAFMSWYTAEASGRPLVAYNGRQFDFDVLSDHVVEYCPRYAEEWSRAPRFDPYGWAVEEGNAVLPGRTNKLGDVAAALGHEPSGTDLTGAAVARTYRRWMDGRSAEPDWERFDRYCEDDVQALATVYRALEASSRLAAGDDARRDVSESTTQGTLSEW